MVKSIVLLSGGLDSTVALGYTKEKYGINLALTFDYGQKSADKEILKTAREILPKAQTIYTQIIPKEKGERFISVLEKETGEKFDIPNDVLYSTLYYEGYNNKEDKSVTSIFFHCEEKYGKKGKMLGDSISIDINI